MTGLVLSVAAVALLVLAVWVNLRGDAALFASHQAKLEQCRLALQGQPLRPITHTRWLLDGPSDLIWALSLIPAFLVMAWIDPPFQLLLLSALLLLGLLLDNWRRSREFELAIEGTRIRWGWAHQRDRQQSIDLRHTLLIAHVRVEATGGDSGSYSLSLPYHLDDGTGGHFPGADNLTFVQEFLQVVNQVRPGVAPSLASSANRPQ